MKLTVLGNYGPYPKAGGACSGYLVDYEGTKVLLDCGNGVFSNLQKVCKLEELDAIILTHLHPDHISDIFIVRYALQFKDLSLSIFAPNEPQKEFERLFYKTYDIHTISEGKFFQIGSLKFGFQKMQHVLPNYAISVQGGGKKVVYSGDTSYTENLIDFSKDADLLLCEAGVLERDIPKNPPHLSAKQSAEIAQKAGAARLVLTHFYPEYSIDMYQREVEDRFKGIVEYAEVMKSFYIS